MNQQSAVTSPSASFPFESRYVSIDGYKIHYIEEGQGDPILFIHGNPTSSYIWRNILPTVARETKRRGIALDLLGFGRSDKPDIDYTLHLHYKILEGFITQLKLRNLILVMQDWGGPFGCYYAVHHPEKIRGIALMETFLWQWKWDDFGKYKIPFKMFRSPMGYIMIQILNMFVNKLIPGSVLNKQNLTKKIMSHYREPFPTVKSRRAIQIFPKLIPVEGVPKSGYEFMKEIEEGLPAVKSPVLLIKADPGIIVDSEEKISRFKRMLPQLVVKDFGPGLHFIQEDNPEKITSLLVEWIRENQIGG